MAKTDSKDHILQKTFYLLLAKGYDGVSITDIQRETGMSRGLLYHYYGSKEALFRIAGETFLTDLFFTGPAQTKEFGLLEMIIHIISRYKDLYKNWSKYPAEANISIAKYDFLIYQMIEKEKRIARMYAEMRDKEMAAWIQAAHRSLQNKEIRAVLKADRIANHFIALLDGVWLKAVEEGNARKHVYQAKQVLMDYYELLK